MRPGGGAPDTPGWSDAGRAQPLSGAAARPGAAPSSGGTAARGRAPSPAAATRCSTSRRSGEPDLFASRPATGAHEVIINAPGAPHRDGRARRAATSPTAVATWRERMRAHSDASYVQLIVNEGGGAGASLEHTHAQLYALPFVPAAVARERERAGAYGERTAGGGLLGDVLVEEVRRRERLVAIDDEAALICPWASRSPFELRVVPRREAARFEEDTGGAAMIQPRCARSRERFDGAAGAQPLGAHRARAEPSTSTGTSTSPRGSRSRPASSWARGSTSTSTRPSGRADLGPRRESSLTAA